MKALLKQSLDAEDVTLQQIGKPEPGPNEVVVKVHFAGICGTDMKIYDGHYHAYKTPLVLGHEFSGQVVAIGADVEGLEIGTNVVARTIYSSCGKCESCMKGRENLCAEKTRIGFDHDGVFAEYVRVHKDQVHILPKEIDLISASLIEPFTVVVHALNPITIKPSDVVLVIGPGPIGLMSVLLAKAYGATVVVAGLIQDKQRQELALKLGADMVLFSDYENSDSALLNLTDGEGPHVVLECSGTSEGVNQGLKLCRRGGHYVQIGTRSTPINVDFMKIAYKEIIVTGGIGHTKIDWENAIRIVQEKKVDFSPLIQNFYKLEDWKEAFQAIQNKEQAKVLFKL
ncbi:L-iditol 2-dehydrogenase [Mesobacillus persicus]|uniref:L-iditol 2-dehydrogenase n=1 Tax=Mesobacillus persicus TaxID=930146 RepID=A0A1H8D8B4_9BACI|nr:alcohol dehydrogenase catalytic domain-containing protein [Mesobacillus persicus]SEN03395.1 L-iditol 2-dehydrogenase [Mesobacillus persicus]